MTVRIVRLTRVPGAVMASDAAHPADRSSRFDEPWCGIAIDVLRATSTLSAAREAGAERIVPCASPPAALAFRAAHPEALACGERGGRIVEGFDLGNSPFEYTAGRVAGRTLAFASTNGSRALLELQRGRPRLLGAFVNASAVLARARAHARIRICCAGSLGNPSPEDDACAGWLIARLLPFGYSVEGDDAMALAAAAPRDAADVRRVVVASPHAQDLIALGESYRRDVEFCATLDRLESAPTF